MSAARTVEGAQPLESEARVLPSVRGQSLAPVDVPDALQVDIASVAGGALDLLEATHRLHGVEVVLELPDDPVIARVSRRRAEQVMLLLLVHAVDASNPQGPAVQVVVDPPDDFGDEGPRFQVVSPSGALSERELKAVFLSPLLVGSAHRRLARARELVESMGGTLQVSSSANSGITVTVELPAPGLASW